jgi:hypothetical protein
MVIVYSLDRHIWGYPANSGRTEFLTLSGPVCADGYYWYEVDYAGQIGWIAEGDNTSYYVEPY